MAIIGAMLMNAAVYFFNSFNIHGHDFFLIDRGGLTWEIARASRRIAWVQIARLEYSRLYGNLRLHLKSGDNVGVPVRAIELTGQKDEAWLPWLRERAWAAAREVPDGESPDS